ncbi:PrsW family intramembrane metalloprotease [Nocardia sp. NPDC057353]|uniref:PrsW family intramembrane metalloprotease n=1 Tax=Nocardia sp. NPDC057353 TaxID=3346104 RepID=UPI0036263DAA
MTASHGIESRGADDALLAARAEAIRNSGWGQAFRFAQPRNLAFWVYVVLVAIGAVSFTRYVGGQAPAYGEALIVATVLFALYCALFWWFTQRIDRYAHQSWKLIVLAFVWGAFAAPWAMAANANTPMLEIWGKLFGQAWAADWGAGLTAPFTEEISKGLGLLLLIAIAPRLVRTAFDGFVLGAFIGLGFQILEDIQYALTSSAAQFGANPVGNAMFTIVMRMTMGVAAHILYSAVFCAGLVYLLGRPAEPRRRGLGLALMATAMLLHGIWDNIGGIAGGATAVMFLLWIGVIAIAIVVVTRVFAITVPRERAFMRDVLAPEVATGVVTAEEVDTLAGDRKARRAYRKRGRNRAQRRQRDHVLEAVHDLADQLAEAGGRDTGTVLFARQEITRLRG